MSRTNLPALSSSRRPRLPGLAIGLALLALWLPPVLLGCQPALDRPGPTAPATPSGSPPVESGPTLPEVAGAVQATTLSPDPAGERTRISRPPASVGPAAWAPAREVSAAETGSAVFPAVALDATGGVHVVWTEDYRIKYSTSRWDTGAMRPLTATGATPSPSRPAEVRDLGPGSSARPAIAAAGNQIHLAWGNLDTGQVMYARFAADGTPARPPTGIGMGNAAAIAARGSAVAIIWQRVDGAAPHVRFRASADGGTTWGPEEEVSGAQSTGFGQTVAIDATGSPHAAFASGDRRVFSSQRGPGGWEKPALRGDGYWPYLAADDAGAAFLVFQGTDQDIRFARWSAGRWQPAVKINQSPGPSFFPRLAWDSSDSSLHVAWQEGDGNGSFQVYYSRGLDQGTTWSPMVSATQHGAAKVVSPDLKATDGGLHLVVQDTTGQRPAAGYRIWYQCTACDPERH